MQLHEVMKILNIEIEFFMRYDPGPRRVGLI